MSLLLSRRFLPLFLIQISSSFADNEFKSAFTMFATYRLPLTGAEAGMLGAAAAAMVVVPFVLYSANAARMADSIERGVLLRGLKYFELVTALVAVAALLIGNLTSGLIALFAFGAQAAVSSPVKYALLPQYLKENELVAGNGLFEGGTFIATLAGGILGNLAAEPHWGAEAAGGVLIVSVLIGVIASQFLEPAPCPNPGARISWIPLKGAGTVIRQAAALPAIHLPILGISWYWVIGAILLSQFPAWTKQSLDADNTVVTLFLTVFSVGILIGAVLCGRLLKGQTSGRLAGPSALIMAVALFDLWFTNPAAHPAVDNLVGILGFVASPEGWRVLADLAVIAICGGVFVVPLYAVVQQRSPPDQRAGMVAANNIWNATFMTIAAALCALMLAFGVSVPGLFAVLAAGTLVTALLSFRYLRQMDG